MNGKVFSCFLMAGPRPTLACLTPSEPVSACAVQEENQRIRFVAFVVVRHKQDVLGVLAVGVLVDAILEALRRFVGSGAIVQRQRGQHEHGGPSQSQHAHSDHGAVLGEIE